MGRFANAFIHLQIILNLVADRPGANNFTNSEVLQNFTRANAVRLRLLQTNTMKGHLMDGSLSRRDPTVTRRVCCCIEICM